MQVQGTALMERPIELPAVAGSPWFETEGKPFVLRMAFPLSFAEMVAALYSQKDLMQVDLATVEDVCGQLAVTLVLNGMVAIERTVEKITRDEQDGCVANPSWLAFCRERVTAVVTGEVAR